MTKKELEKELKDELAARRRIWAKTKTKDGGFFFNWSVHQLRYDRLKYTLELLQDMTDKDFMIQVKKRSEKIKQQNAQQNLF